MSKRVRWGDEDKEALIQRGVEVRRRHPSLSMLQVFNKAQNIAIDQKDLSHEKRRNITTLSMVPWFESEVVSRIKNPSPEIIKIEKSLADFSTDELLRELGERVLKPILSQMIQLPTQSTTSTTSKKPTRARLPKIVIVGLLNEQRQTIKNKFNDLNLTFAEGNGSDLQDKVKHADHVILMTKFIRHAAQEIAKSSGRAQLSYVNGGVNELSRKLGEIRT